MVMYRWPAPNSGKFPDEKLLAIQQVVALHMTTICTSESVLTHVTVEFPSNMQQCVISAQAHAL